MTGVIIAGGLGTRLRSVLADKPKCLADVCGKPFLFYLLEQMTGAGVKRIVLCTGYQAGQVEECVGTRFSGVPVVYSREDEPLGTAGALRLAFDRHGCDEPWLVMNGDSYLDIDIPSLRSEFDRSSCFAVIAAAHVADGCRFGSLKCASDGRVLAFEEKSDVPGPKWINGGVYLLSTTFLESIPKITPLSLERDVFPQSLAQGVLTYPCHGRFIDIGIPPSFALAQSFFAEAASR